MLIKNELTIRCHAESNAFVVSAESAQISLLFIDLAHSVCSSACIFSTQNHGSSKTILLIRIKLIRHMIMLKVLSHFGLLIIIDLCESSEYRDR